MTNLITNIKTLYEENLSNILRDIYSAYDIRESNDKIWQQKKDEITGNIRLCFDCLIIPKDVLTCILKTLKKTAFSFLEIQRELLQTLEGDMQSDFEIIRNNHHDIVTEFNANNILRKCNISSINTEQIKDFLFIPQDIIDNIIRELTSAKNSVLKQYPMLKYEDYRTVLKSIHDNGVLSKEKYDELTFILQEKNDMLQHIESAYNNIVKMKYILSPPMNNETLFALGFITDSSIFEGSNILRKILYFRTQLYKDILSELPNSLKEIFKIDFTKDTVFAINKIDTNEKSLIINKPELYLYQRLSLLVAIHQNIDIVNTLNLKRSSAFNRYCLQMQEIIKETYLLFPDILPKDYSNLEIFMDILNLRDKEIAEIFNMDTAEFSRKKKNPQIIEGLWVEKLSIFYKFHQDYMLEKTTIPAFGSSTKIMPIEIKQNKWILLDEFKNFYTKKLQELQDDTVKEKYTYLIKHINLLEKNVKKLNEEDFAAIDHLLRFKAK